MVPPTPNELTPARLRLVVPPPFGHSVNLNKKNYARAVLILCAVSAVIWIIFGGIFIGALSSLMESSYSSSDMFYY